jgi:hypothetical protein
MYAVAVVRLRRHISPHLALNEQRSVGDCISSQASARYTKRGEVMHSPIVRVRLGYQVYPLLYEGLCLRKLVH